MVYDLTGKKVWVAGDRGMVGSAIVRRLQREGCQILQAGRTSLDLTRQRDVEQWIEKHTPQAIFVAAAKVGGIQANINSPADFLYTNLMIEANIVEAARQVGVEKLLMLGSSCIYPREAPQPMTEDVLLTGALERTNEPYAVAKIAGIKLCQTYRRQHNCDYICAMPTNVYGPGDNFAPGSSHVPAALLDRFHQAKTESWPSVTVWGTGQPRREFLHVDDLADACVFLMQRYSGEEIINLGTGSDISIAEFASLLAETVGYRGDIRFDTSRPDGAPRKLLDVSKARALGWSASIELRDGLRMYYEWYLDNTASLRR